MPSDAPAAIKQGDSGVNSDGGFPRSTLFVGNDDYAHWPRHRCSVSGHGALHSSNGLLRGWANLC